MERARKGREVTLYGVNVVNGEPFSFSIDFGKEVKVIEDWFRGRMTKLLVYSGRNSTVDLTLFNVPITHREHCFLFENFWLAHGYLIKAQKGEIEHEPTDHN